MPYSKLLPEAFIEFQGTKVEFLEFYFNIVRLSINYRFRVKELKAKGMKL